MEILQLKNLPRFQQARAEQAKLEERESWSRKKIEDWQLQRINRVWQHARQYVPFYRELATRNSIPPVFDSLQHYQQSIPVVTGHHLRGKSKEFLSQQPGPGKWYRTSGTLAIPLKLFRETTAHREFLAARYRFYSTWGIDMLDRVVQLWGQYSVPPRELRQWPAYLRQICKDKLRGRLRLSAYRTSPQQLQSYLKKIASFQPVGIYGFAQSVLLLALEAHRLGFRCSSLKGIVITSELITPAMIHQIREAFDVPVAQEYGCTECELIAGMSPEGNLLVREDLVYLETPAHENGVYRIVFTMLNNPSFPLLRYELADVCDIALVKPEMGFARLNQHCGRLADLIRRPDRKVVLPNQIDAIFREKGIKSPIRRYLVYQDTKGGIDVKLDIYNDRKDQLDLFRLQEQLRHLTGHPISVEIVSEIPTLFSGKHRPLISDFGRQCIK